MSDNQFSGSIVGMFLDGTNSSINAAIVGNTIPVSPNSIAPSEWEGIVAQGTGATAPIGGSGAGDANTIENYAVGYFILEATGSGANSGRPNLTILTNNYLRNGNPVDPSAAIHRV